MIAAMFWEHIHRVFLELFSIVVGEKPKRKNGEAVALYGDTEYAQDILCLSTDAADQLVTINAVPDPPPRIGHK